jgi:molecular chaperone Hsp33
MDKLLRATTKNGEIRAFAANTKELVNVARTYHQTTPVASAALGRLLTAGVMMGSMLKGEQELLTLNIKGDGPIGGVLVTANGAGQVKGYVNNPLVDLPLKANGKLDVSGAIGAGNLTVIKDLGMKEPYVGQVELVSGEIAEDITYYYASSEQTPSVVALGVLVDVDYSIRQSGGFIIQLLPQAKEETIEQLEKNIQDLPSITQMYESGLDEEGILKKVLEGFEVLVHDISTPEYYCNCSRERVEKALITIGKDELDSMIQDGEPIEMNCHFCDKKYIFEMEDLKKLI